MTTVDKEFDLEKEFSENGFETTLGMTKEYASTIWRGEKWEIWIVWLTEVLIMRSNVFKPKLFLFRLRIIRTILTEFDCERGHSLPEQEFQLSHLWSLVMFTTDGRFCNVGLGARKVQKVEILCVLFGSIRKR